MGLDSVIKLAVAMVIVAAGAGQLPRVTNKVRRAQIKLLQHSEASRWGSPDLLYAHRAKKRGHF